MDKFTWEIKVPIFKNKIIITQLFAAIGIPFGILIIFLLIIKAYNGLMLIGAVFLLAFIIMLLVFRGTYDVMYVLDEKSVLCQTQIKQKKRVKKLSTTVFFLGLLKGNYTAAGIGLISGAGTDMKIPWRRVKKVKYKDKQKTIMISASFGEHIALFCIEENYNEVKKFVEKSIIMVD